MAVRGGWRQQTAARSPAVTFVALDFETANQRPDSACAMALVRVENGVIVERACHLIRPPSRRFQFERIHGISLDSVASAAAFPEVWALAAAVLRDTQSLAAHNASFERKVLRGCFRRYGLTAPAFRFACTVQLARDRLGIRPACLSNVCRQLGITLRHHDPLSDAEACARIVLASGATEQDWR